MIVVAFKLDELQQKITSDPKDRIACAMARQTGKDTVAASRAYRASAAGKVLVLVPSRNDVTGFYNRFIQVIPEGTRVTSRMTATGMAISAGMETIHVMLYKHIFLNERNRKKILDTWGIGLIQELIMLEPSTQVVKNKNMPITRKGFADNLDASSIFNFIHYMTDTRAVQVTCLIGTPIIADPIFQFCFLAPNRWSFHHVTMLQMQWSARKYADMKMSLSSGDHPDKFGIILAQLEAKWKGDLYV